MIKDKKLIMRETGENVLRKSSARGIIKICGYLKRYKSDSMFDFIFLSLIFYVLVGFFWSFRFSGLYGWFNIMDIKRDILWLGVFFIIVPVLGKFFECMNLLTSLICIFISYSVLSLLATHKWGKFLFYGMIAALAYIFVQIIYILVKQRKYKKIRRLCKRIILKFFLLTYTIFLISAMLLEVQDVVHSLVRVKGTREAYLQVHEVEEHIFRNNLSVLEKFTESSWQSMSQGQREAACLQLAQLELMYMTGKTDNNLTLYICNDYWPEAGGFYDEDLNRIVVDEQYQANREYVIEVVCHESFHYLEHKLIEGAEDIHGLSSAEAIEQYRVEMDNYININEDFEGYYNQLCESDARDYAKKTVVLYLNYIDRTFQ